MEALLFLVIISEIALPILAAQKWGPHGFVRANLWIGVCNTLAYIFLPKFHVALLGWFLAPGLGMIFMAFLLLLSEILRPFHVSSWLLTYLTMLAPQLMFMSVGILIWLAFRRTARIREQ